MTIHTPPQYRYPLSTKWSKDLFVMIKDIAKTKRYPSIVGSREDKNAFLITLIRTQKALHNWEAIFIEMVKQIKSANTIDTATLTSHFPPSSISKDTPEWATYDEDKIVSDFIDELGTRPVDFVGTDEEMAEFIFRFILGQLGLDWESTIMMIWEMLGDENSLQLRELNNELKNFDYIHLFDNESK
ncbi:hypothetical protein KC726_00605 [Candidatus Woesebacteria bacterium]|nr:hypothetical protein [Candidatus Woesebacteria bacterium]